VIIPWVDILRIVLCRSSAVFEGFIVFIPRCRTVARQSSIGGLYVCGVGFAIVQWGLDIKFDKNSTNL